MTDSLSVVGELVIRLIFQCINVESRHSNCLNDKQCETRKIVYDNMEMAACIRVLSPRCLLQQPYDPRLKSDN